MNEHEPALGLAVLHHIEKVVDERVKQAIKQHELEAAPWRKDVDDDIKALRERIDSGFPHDDPPAHRRVHEQYITEANDRKDVRKSLMSHVINAGVLGAALLIVNALWDYFKANIK